MTKVENDILNAVLLDLAERGCRTERGREGAYFAKRVELRTWWILDTVYDHDSHDLQVELDNNELTTPFYVSILDPEMFQKIWVILGCTN